MKIGKCLIYPAFFFVAAFSGAVASASEGRGGAVVFASERLMDSHIGSYFSNLDKNQSQQNECELAIGKKLKSGGFTVRDVQFGSRQIRDARKMNAVFGRYKDISAMPNDMAIRAASIVDNEAVLLVACGVNTKAVRKDAAGQICATANCKGVDMKSMRRVAASTGQACVLPEDADTPASVAAVRDVCEKLGGDIINKIAGRYLAAEEELRQ